MVDEALPAITLRYRTSRGEIWHWYWRVWRQKLWRNWVIVGVAAAAISLFFDAAEHPVGRSDFETAAGFVLAVWLILAAYPQYSFKGEERVLIIGRDGIDTVIGAKSAHRGWNEIASVTETGPHIVVTVAKSGNAFLIPNRAFGSAGERAALLRSVTVWRTASKTS